MKRIVGVVLCLFAVSVTFAQTDSILPPYKKVPIYPPVKLLLPDSASYFTKEDLPKKSAVLLMLFNPDCSHCRHETEEIIKHIDEFKDVQIVMATMMPYRQMMAFREEFRLADYKNIVVGCDENYFLSTFYMIRNLPYLAFYDRKRALISVYEGSMPIEKVIAVFKK